MITNETQRIKGLHQALTKLYAHDCAHCVTLSADDKNEKDDPNVITEKDVERMARNIYSGGDYKKIDKTTTRKIARTLTKYMREAMDEVKIQPDDTLREDLEKSLYQFSGAKVAQQQRTLTRAVIDPETTHKRSFKEFKQIAHEIDKQYNKVWLKTEQNQAYASAQMASRWASFSEGNLMYRTAGDGRVRPAHQELDGVIQPKSADFWKAYYPPNGWGCRCSVIETNESAPEEKLREVPNDPPNVPVEFRENTAAKRIIFPSTHPYYKGAKNGVKQGAELYKEDKAREEQRKNLTHEEIKKSKNETKAYMYEHFEGKEFQLPEVLYKNPDTGKWTNEKIISLLKRSHIKTLVEKPHEYLEKKNRLLRDIENLIKKSTFEKWAIEKKGRPQYDRWFYFKYKDGYYINVVKKIDGTYEIHAITDRLENTKKK